MCKVSYDFGLPRKRKSARCARQDFTGRPAGPAVMASRIEEKHEQVGKTIARFEVLYVELTSAEDFVLVMVFYTEMKL